MSHLHLRAAQVLRGGALPKGPEAIPVGVEIASGEEQERPRNDI